MEPLLAGSSASAPGERRAQLKRYVEAELEAVRPYVYLTRAFAVAAVIAVIAFIYAGIDNNAFSSVLFFQLETDYGAVIDAGSHGSRLHLYQWPARIHDPDHPLSGPISLPAEIYALRAEPGISATVDDGGDPDRAGELCIGPLIDQLKIVLIKLRVQPERWSDIPVFVKATAGMRDLDSASRSAIMNSIREYIANETPFLFHWSWARITAGEEEGVYGWLTVNSALGTLLMPAGETFGAMDLGGASMQITYAPLRTSVLESYYGLSLGGQSIHLYSHSFLGYGWGDSMTRLTTRLAVESVVETLQAEGFDELHFDALHSYLLKQQVALADATADLIFPPTLPRVQQQQQPPLRSLQQQQQPESLMTPSSPPPPILIDPVPPPPSIIAPPRPTANDTIVVGSGGQEVLIPPQGPLVVNASDAATATGSGDNADGDADDGDGDEDDDEGGDDDVGAPRADEPRVGSPLLVHVRASHPCYPSGHAFQYYLPGLVQPEGRLFLDSDIEFLITYMRFAGVSEDLIKKIVTPRLADPVGGGIEAEVEELLNRAAQRLANGEQPSGSLPTDHWRASRRVRRRMLAAARDAAAAKGDAEGDPEYSLNALVRAHTRDVMQHNMRAMLLDEADPLHYADPADEGDGYGPAPEMSRDSQDGDDENRRRRLQNDVAPAAPGEGDHRASLFAHAAGLPFRPLTGSTQNLDGAPQVQYVIDFEGSSDPETCRERARDLFYQQPCFVHSCSFNGIYMPAKDGSHFIAFGQFSRVQQALNTTANVSPAALAEASDEVCRATKDELRAAHDQGRYLPYGKNGVLLLCWKSLWTYTVLNWGYGFPGNSTQITFAQTVGDGPNARAVGWADGSMIVEVNNFPWKTPLGRFEVPFLLASAVGLLFAATTWLVMVQLRSRGRIIKLAGLDGSHVKRRRGSGERRSSDLASAAPGVPGVPGDNAYVEASA